MTFLSNEPLIVHALLLDHFFRPVEGLLHQRENVLARGGSSIRGLNGDSRPPLNHVIKMAGALVSARVNDLGCEYAVAAFDDPGETRSLGEHAEQVDDATPVASE